MRDAFIDRAQQGPLEAWSRFNPFNNLVRNVEMKSTDKKILILVASLALLLAGCGGGGSSTTAPVDPGPTPAETAIMEAETALETAQAAVSGAMTDAEMRDAYRAVQQAADSLVMVLKANGGSPAAVEAATTTRQTAMYMADNLAQKIEDDAVAADAAMTALAAKLYTAIGAKPLGDRTIGLPAHSGDLTGISNTGVLTVHNVSVNVPSAAAGPQLKEDKSTMVPPLHGWTGSRHTATVAAGTPAPERGTIGAGTYTAHLYSNVGEPTQGDPFNEEYTLTAADAANPGETAALATGVVGTTTEAELDVQARIASMSFDQSAGTKAFELPTNTVRVMVPGSYHGVSGNYYCAPNTGNSCAAQVAAKGFALGGVADNTNAFTVNGGTWTFKPGDPKALVTAEPDEIYPVYGWWLHEALDGTTTVSPFTSYRSTDGLVNLSPSTNAFAGAIPIILHGTATYRGGAAGMYALQSSTGGMNDAGHFTADAELKATFSTTAGGTFTTDINHKIEGTIDNFMGSDGMSRDWSVALKEGSIDYSGLFPTETGSRLPKTTWSIGGTDAGESGQWKGNLYKQNDGGVPTVGTGVFHSEYDNIGRMVGAFGVNLEE